MSFDSPTTLVIALAIGALAVWLYRRAQQRTHAQTLRYSNIEFLSGAIAAKVWPMRVLRAAWIAAVAMLAIATAGPRLVLPVPALDGSVFICIDTSGSMASTDVQPTRAQAAAEAARAFITQAPAGVRIGLIAFATNAELIAPLNADKETTLAALEQLPSPNGATAIGDALRLAASQLPPSGHRVVVLITDGVNNSGVDPQVMATYFGAHHVPIYTIGIGTPNGDLIGGEQASIDEGALQGYAQASGGAYARAENAGELRDALARLGRETTIVHRKVAAAAGFALAGGIVLVLCTLTGLGLGRYP
jgi:Ca-activated chloride channel family protein